MDARELPYGYMETGKGAKKNPNEVAVIRVIFSFDHRTGSCRQIAEYLNKHGFWKRDGGPWTQEQVSVILSRQDLYKQGIVKYGKLTLQSEDLIIL
jgi:hypothetical protein